VRQGSVDEQSVSVGVRPNCVRPGSIDEQSETGLDGRAARVHRRSTGWVLSNAG